MRLNSNPLKTTMTMTPLVSGSVLRVPWRLLLFLMLVIASAVPAAGQEQAPLSQEPEDDRPDLALSLQATVELALRHNLQVQIASYAPDQQEEQIMASRARFDPVAALNLPQTFQRDVRQGTSQLAGAPVLTSETVQAGFSFSHLLEYGTDWSLQWGGTRTATNNTFSTFNPQFSSSLTLDVTQPLLQGFGTEVNRQPIIIARNNFAVSEEQFRQQVQNIVFQTYQAYWQLVFAERNLEVAQLSLELAEEQLERNRIQVEIGTRAPIETIQAEQQVANRGLALIQARVAVQDREDDLKRLINVEASSPHGWEVDLVPTSEPPTEIQDIDVEEAIATALDNDPLLAQRRIQLESQQLNVRVARNGLLPQLNFSGSIQLSGQGGDRIFSPGFGSDVVLEIQEGGFSDALHNMLSGDFRNWSVGLSLRLPINNWAARAEHAQALISERSTLAQIADREQELRVEVLQAARQVQSGVQQVEQAQTATELARRQLEAEERKYAVGSTTNFEVLEFQRQLSDAQTQELQSIINLANALARLEQAQGTLIRSLGFDIRMAGVPDGAASR